MATLHSSPSTIHVPQLVENYLDRVLPDEGTTPRRVKIAQTGEMWLKPDGRALRFSAVEELRIEKIRLLWEAKVRVAPLVSLHVTDRYEDGYGSLHTTLLGIPLARARGPEIAAGQVMRYLAELPWAPFAMRDNSLLEWREIDEAIVEVATSVGGSRIAVCLRFDDSGHVLAAFSHRPRREGREVVTRPWMACTATTRSSAGSGSRPGRRSAGRRRTGRLRISAELSPRSSCPRGRRCRARATRAASAIRSPERERPIRGHVATSFHA